MGLLGSILGVGIGATLKIAEIGIDAASKTANTVEKVILLSGANIHNHKIVEKRLKELEEKKKQ